MFGKKKKSTNGKSAKVTDKAKGSSKEDSEVASPEITSGDALGAENAKASKDASVDENDTVEQTAMETNLVETSKDSVEVTKGVLIKKSVIANRRG